MGMGVQWELTEGLDLLKYAACDTNVSLKYEEVKY